jgi:hypothetical protein
MALETVEQVTAAINAIVDGDHPNGMKSIDRQVRNSRLADLYEIRASLWRELGVKARTKKSIPDHYAKACAVAETHDRGLVTFFRNLAGQR